EKFTYVKKSLQKNMILKKPLDYVFATWSNIAILRVLSSVKTPLSGREIAKLSGMSAPSALQSLSSLENLNLIIRNRGGREHFFSLNRENYFIKKIIIPAISNEKKFPKEVFKEIKNNLGEFAESLILFGSVARGEEQVQSDFDLCIVYQGQANRKKIDSVIPKLREILHLKYGLSLAPFLITKKEFYIKARNNISPVNNIIKEGKILFGKTIKDLTNGS
ncbi:MAG: nucleotidyltransferase domain-containing protein, partial [Ignavibacterium sp.]